ncbi:MAG TPA: DUF2269 family protein [Gaiellaceae bacterium]|nr:DUF2269 family protein [Gaiellaceae bacterium]
MYQTLLFFHLLSVIALFAGGAVAAAAQYAALGRKRPSEIATLLGVARRGVPLVGSGALGSLGFGIGLAEHLGLAFRPAWIQAALALWVLAMALGGYGGGYARRARELAERLAAAGDAPSPELQTLVRDPRSLWTSTASGLVLLAIVGLMVWQP